MKTICVLGSTGVIGQELASFFHLENCIEASRSLKSEKNKISVDLSNLKSVWDFVKKLSEFNLDYLFLNSGVYEQKRYTQEGYEYNFMVNAFSPYYIAKRILSVQPNCSIIFTSSISILHAKQNLCPKKWKYIYRNTKLIGHALLNDLKVAFPSASISFAHPGIVPSRLSFGLHSRFVNYMIRIFGNTPSGGAQCLVMAANQTLNASSWITPSGIFSLRGRPKLKRIKKPLNVSKEVWEMVKKLEKELEKYGI